MLDGWNDLQIRQMKLGGNKKASAFLKDAHNNTHHNPSTFYTSKKAEVYKEELKRDALIDSEKYLFVF